MPIKSIAVFCLLFAFIQSPARAQDATGDDAILAPYLTKTTLVLARVNISSLDPASIDAFYSFNLFGDVGAQKKWVADFTKAGGKRAYAIVDLALLPQSPFIFITPLAPGADAHALRNLEEHGNSNDAPPGGDQLVATYIVGNNLILVGNADTLKKLPQLQAVPRQGLLKALSTAGPGGIDAAFESTDEARKILVPMMPSLTPELGASANEALLKGLTNIQLDLPSPLGTGIHLAINCSSPEAVANVKTFLSAATAFARDYMLGPGNADSPAAKAFLLNILTPKEQASTFTLDWDNHTLQTKVVPILMALQIRAAGPEVDVQMAVNAESKVIMHEMMIDLLLYENDHHGEYPDSFTVKDLAGVVDDNQLARLMTDPAHRERNPGYVYLKPTNAKTAPSDTVMIYETIADSDTHLNVGFVDGTVKHMARADFDKALAKTKDINAGK